MAGRGAFDTRIGFVMAAVGSAVGLGNLWRFPYVVSTNGGAVFLFIYLAFLFLIGIPALFAELSIGRAKQQNAVHAFKDHDDDKRFTWIGVLFLVTATLLLSYYSVIAGWAVNYAFEGVLRPLGQELPGFFDDAASYWSDLAVSPLSILFHLAFMAITIGIVIRGVSKGIEKANLIMMPVLFLFIVALVIYGNFQSGAGAGREFYLTPDFGDVDIGTLSDAAGQTFFSIGLGLGTMLTYSSYIGRDSNLQKTGLTIGITDTAVAVLAGFMVFPLMFSLGLQDLISPDNSGSVGGLFIVLPTAFAQIGGLLGVLLGAGFFIMLSFAAISSAISLLEVPVSYVNDRMPDWGRVRSVLVVGIPVYLFGLPAAISLDWLTMADNLVNNVLLLTGGLLLVLYVGWLRPEILDELRIGVGKGERDLATPFRYIIRYPLPLFLVTLLILGIVSFIRAPL